MAPSGGLRYHRLSSAPPSFQTCFIWSWGAIPRQYDPWTHAWPIKCRYVKHTGLSPSFIRNIPSMVSDMDGEQSIDTPSYVCAKHAHTLTVWLLLMGCSDGVIWQRHERNSDSFFTTRVIYSFFITLHKQTHFVFYTKWPFYHQQCAYVAYQLLRGGCLAPSGHGLPSATRNNSISANWIHLFSWQMRKTAPSM